MEILKHINELKTKGIAYICYDTGGSGEDGRRLYARNIYDYYKELYFDVVVLSYSTHAKYNNIDNILPQGTGGTYMSSPLTLLMQDAERVKNDKELCHYAYNFNPNNIIVLVGDGDNWSEDNDRFCRCIEEITKTNSVVYHEILGGSHHDNTMYKRLKAKRYSKVHLYKVEKEQDIFGNKKKQIKGADYYTAITEDLVDSIFDWDVSYE
jgi:uncharacterized sporulation protein YeaH/YhbH (DUF444 family)